MCVHLRLLEDENLGNLDKLNVDRELSAGQLSTTLSMKVLCSVTAERGAERVAPRGPSSSTGAKNPLSTG